MTHRVTLFGLHFSKRFSIATDLDSEQKTDFKHTQEGSLTRKMDTVRRKFCYVGRGIVSSWHVAPNYP